MFIDLNMVLTQWMVSENILVNALVQIAGCTILGFGIAMEVKCGSVTMPGEGDVYKRQGLFVLRHLAGIPPPDRFASRG